MTEICNRISCTACGACLNICNANAIIMKEDAEGFLYPSIDESSCVDCGACRKVCPASKETVTSQASFYMAWNKDDEILKKVHPAEFLRHWLIMC